jgi:hypothetical protein
MPSAIPQRVLTTLTPQVESSPAIRVRIAAHSFIPWEWVKFPEPPPEAGFVGMPHLTVPAMGLSAALDFFVHGDGRMPAKRSDDVGTRFRTQGVAEVDVIQQPRETFAVLARNQPSKSELRLIGGKVLYGPVKSGPLTSRITADRIDPNSVSVNITVSGSVPWNVAGPQPAIDFKYSVKLAYDRAAKKVKWSVNAAHDGFPGHEVFIEQGSAVRFNKSYLPDWFSPPSTGTARPSILQAISGAKALGGIHMPQAWAQAGEFTP